VSASAQMAIAYGDSPDDVALLEQAEQAVAVNAQRKLTRTAVHRDWRRISWR
jgi:phosphoserine phosphatase